MTLPVAFSGRVSMNATEQGTLKPATQYDGEVFVEPFR